MKNEVSQSNTQNDEIDIELVSDEKYDQMNNQSNKSLNDLICEEKKRSSINRKLLELAHLRFSLLKFFERHNFDMDNLIILQNIDDTLRLNIPNCKLLFNHHADTHKCSIKGCKACLIIDGNPKNTRKRCAVQNLF